MWSPNLDHCNHAVRPPPTQPSPSVRPPAIKPERAVFRSVDDGTISLLVPKVVFCALNFAGVCIALWKMAKMGLLPVTAADWTSYLVPKHSIEHSGVPLI